VPGGRLVDDLNLMFQGVKSVPPFVRSSPPPCSSSCRLCHRRHLPAGWSILDQNKCVRPDPGKGLDATEVSAVCVSCRLDVGNPIALRARLAMAGLRRLC
jgi:hypothetical protein